MRRGIAAIAAAGIIVLTLTAFAAETPEPDDVALRNYALTMDKVQRYAAATNALSAAIAKSPALKADMNKMQDESDKNVTELRQKLAHHPSIAAYYKQQGLTDEDAVLIPLVATNALSALDAQYSDDLKELVSPDQLAFAKAHQDELTKLLHPTLDQE